MSRKIYFDLDGVLADFEAAAKPMKDNEDLNHPTDELGDAQKQRKVAFWRKIEGTDFFATLPEMPNAARMLDAARTIAGENLFILSKAPNAKNFISGETWQIRIAEQKTEWVLSHFGNYFPRTHILIVAGGKESICPTKDDVLIDDRAENINGWKAAGGTGILFTTSDNVVAELLKNMS
ncbi:MAG: hypothetical protein LBT45_02840 [Rickettsiales bacterium]|jgi:FMN phosphatase YigB (HAD superfamily)|nr:hypothetical protein [Rickettsiales bacterium]